MARLEELEPGQEVRGIEPREAVELIAVERLGPDVVSVTFRTAAGQAREQILYRDAEPRLRIVSNGSSWKFSASGANLRLACEAFRLRLAHLFDPNLGLTSARIEPLPHQITAVYEHMLPRQPLRFLLADEPGAGKTTMAGLLIQELLLRGDVERCLIVCPGILVEQWQSELSERFDLAFEVATSEALSKASERNWFLNRPLAIVRLDHAARNQHVQKLLSAPECRWDLVVVDEAHKMAASGHGSEIKCTKRYELGQLLAGQTQHLLLLSATPHNGKPEDFTLFLRLLDAERFEYRQPLQIAARRARRCDAPGGEGGFCQIRRHSPVPRARRIYAHVCSLAPGGTVVRTRHRACPRRVEPCRDARRRDPGEHRGLRFDNAAPAPGLLS
ncbi:MAG: DEAD/DEAH box helicase [Candidatus Binatia bacterium]|nr:DEAD/DEAH box helicase [Candidatus Binatia bacterium]